MGGLKRWVKWLLCRAGLYPESNDRLYKGLEIGPNTYYLRRNLDGIAPRLITIGRDCVLSPTAMVLTHDASSFIHTGRYRFAPVRIGDRCFLGYNSVIMPGVSIGNDVIVGAGAVVTKDVPDGVVVAGVPAKVIRRTAEQMARWEGLLVEPPYRFGVFPDGAQLVEFQERALGFCGRMEASTGE